MVLSNILLKQDKSLIVSAPTSFGKSLLIEEEKARLYLTKLSEEQYFILEAGDHVRFNYLRGRFFNFLTFWEEVTGYVDNVIDKYIRVGSSKSTSSPPIIFDGEKYKLSRISDFTLITDIPFDMIFEVRECERGKINRKNKSYR